MKRKVIKQGPVSVSICLPAKWVKKYNIQRGQTLEIKEEDNALIVSTEPIEREIKKEFIVEDFIGDFNKYIINYFYQKGYDEVTIRFKDKKTRTMIENAIIKGHGFDIVERDKHFIKIHALTSTDITKFDTFLRKAFLITIEMGKKIEEAIKQKDYVYLQEIKADEKINNKYCDLCHRILNKKQHFDSENIVFLYALVRDLEKICDHYRELCNDWTKEINNDLLKLFIEVNLYLQNYYNWHYAFSKERTDIHFSQKEKLLEKCRKQLNKTNTQEQLVVFHLMNIIRDVFVLKAPLFLTRI
jgi:phosphate uptake regulator/antitoxin component of MazEF toxin-antitoxin module